MIALFVLIGIGCASLAIYAMATAPQDPDDDPGVGDVPWVDQNMRDAMIAKARKDEEDEFRRMSGRMDDKGDWK